MKDSKPMGMYIHIPFCNRKCDYCDFVSYSMDETAQRQYFEALCLEIDRLKDKFLDKTFDTIYIGGGTPSIVYDGFIRDLSKKLHTNFHFARDTEFTIEINPASFNRKKFMEYLQAGVNRISVGVQCLDSNLLAEQGRIQSMENIEETFNILTDCEYENVSSDVLIGLPNQTQESVKETLEFLIENRVKHISVYTLQVEKHTMLYEKIKNKKLKLPKDKKVNAVYDMARDMLMAEGYLRYEVSNFARPGFQSRHNMKYWTEVDYLGLGVSAHGFIDGYRYYNTKRLDTYIANLKDGKSPVYKREYIADEMARVERLMLSLRTVKGLDLQKFQEDFNENLLKTREEQIKKMIEDGQIEIVDGFLRITDTKYNVLNSIIVELM
jgi:oxygen-independent coproporphyrinogen-3 oxidase